ncbi:MAG: site-specific DNA-methyltransferase [Coriobacteriia bacterium]|nr:site-specific DNA-methyltransferase [Coriobacteriia bacterium]
MPYSDELRRLVVDALNSGEALPQEWQRELFPPARQEIELTYGGKVRQEEVVSSTLAVPFQAASTFGEPKWDDWANMLVFGDNLQAMRHLLDLKRAHKLVNPDGTEGFRLVYIDPPFATRRDFRGSSSARAYSDKLEGARFVEFLRRRIILIRELLADNGFLLVHIDYRWGHYIKVVLDEVFSGGFRNEIKVRRGTKNVQNQFDEIESLTVGDDSLYLYSKSTGTRLPHARSQHSEATIGKWDTFWRGTDRQTMRYELFGQEPTTGQWRWMKSRGKTAAANYLAYLEDEEENGTLDDYYLERLSWGTKLDFVRLNESGVVQYYVPPQESKILSTMWGDVRTIGKVTDYPTEKHEELLARIVNWLSTPGDLVLDCFAGSGTTLAVAEKLERRWIGIDCGKLAIYTIQKRLLTLREGIGNKGRLRPSSKFTVFNAGLYDYSQLKSLDWESWLFFALELFSCQAGEFRLGGVVFQGTRYGSPVLVHNHVSYPKMRIDEDAVRDLHSAVGQLAGSQVYIVAPRNVFRFQEDYLEFDGVRYYALRIPYSFINELHRRQFSAIAQPQTADEVNATVDAVGFDFIEPPTVTFSIEANDSGSSVLVVDEFSSRSRLAPVDGIGRDSLAMVMLDYEYDNEVFDMDKVLYPADLVASDWRIDLPRSSQTGRVMVVFTDLYGNESRHVLETSSPEGA